MHHKELEIEDRKPYRGLLQPKDNVNRPKHYNMHPSGIECIQVVEHMNFNLGNAIKYLWRTDHKNGIEDLKKAVWYINREILKKEREQNDKA